ncbi:acyltransferase [Serratia rhizosphaerae]|uniref:Acyltransferase n=1 Tax=Serratia rhizosphaerae TaxID=2597702 RepID=A0ABX6GSB3_9GAMM|nr:acyltransferase [Serratia rhizosphaerae]
MNFRLDINGLRFLAVTMVVLFHFKFEFAYGGFAGVDIFFVISGFLMNDICQKQTGKK